MIKSDDRQIVNNIPPSGKTHNNLCLIRVELTENKLSSSGLHLGDATWDEAGLCTRHGVIVAVPSHLIYGNFGSEWLTDIEVEVGDHVYWGPMAAYDSPVIKSGGDTFFLIKYQDIVCKEKDREIFPVNGYVVAEEVIEVIRSKSFFLGEKHLRNKGIVKYVGVPNKEYSYAMSDAVDVQPGDTAVLLATMFTYLEDSRYATLPKNLGYFQRRWVVMISR